MGDPTSELTRPRIDVARVKLRVIAGQTREADQVRVQDGPARAPEAHADKKVLVAIAQSRFVAHGARSFGASGMAVRAKAGPTGGRPSSRNRAAENRSCSSSSGPAPRGAA